jgi:hypothetical protein
MDGAGTRTGSSFGAIRQARGLVGNRENAVDDDEAYVMRDALGFLAKALQEAGYAPR